MLNKELIEKGLIGNNCFVYIDDIIVYEKTIEEYNRNLTLLFERLRQVGLKFQLDKCEFLRLELNIWEMYSRNEVYSLIRIEEKVKNYPVPWNSKEIK